MYIHTYVFRRDVLWYDDVCPSVKVFRTFLHMLGHIELKFSMTLFYCTTDQVRVSSVF